MEYSDRVVVVPAVLIELAVSTIKDFSLRLKWQGTDTGWTISNDLEKYIKPETQEDVSGH